MQEHEHVENLLQKAKEAARKDDIAELRNLSDQTIHAAAIHQDTDNVLVAVILYSLSKLIERKESYSEKDFNKYLNYYLKTIEFSRVCISKDDCSLFRNRINEVMKVPGLSKNLKQSIQDVFRKARINKASKIYEHGISMEATANLLGISLWELAEYSGQVQGHDMGFNEAIDIKKRIKTAMEFFE